jgi:hypothetical protein
MATFSVEERRRYARQGIAMEDGSFPIPDRESLQDAIHAVGRARPNTPQHRAAVRRHIIGRARALGAMSMIPHTWNRDGTLSDGSDD